MAKRHWETRRYQISATINSKRALQSKPCASMEACFENIAGKIEKMWQSSDVTTVRMVAGILLNDSMEEYSIARHLHEDLRALVNARFPDLYVVVSDDGIG